jgi:membrane protein
MQRAIAWTLGRSLPGLRGLAIGRVAWLAFKDFFVDDMATYAAAVAFHLLLALFPFVIFLLALLSFLHLQGIFDQLSRLASTVLPGQARSQLAQAMHELRIHATEHGGLLSLGILAALWAASAGTRSVMNALNVAYDVTESRSVWQRYALSLAFTLGFTALVIVSTAVLLLGSVWNWLRLPLALLVLTFAVALIYYVVPNTTQSFQLLTPGAVLAVVVWLCASLVFSTYVSSIAHYSTTYGNIAAIVVLLLFFYISALALLLGAEINAIVQHYAPRERDKELSEQRAGRKPVP